jgi:hypothetical protein
MLEKSLVNYYSVFNIANSVHCSVISHCIKYQLNALYLIYYYFTSHYPNMFRRFHRHQSLPALEKTLVHPPEDDSWNVETCQGNVNRNNNKFNTAHLVSTWYSDITVCLMCSMSVHNIIQKH